MLELDLQDEPEHEDCGPLKCIDCGSEEIHWECIDDKWVLVNNDNGKKHFCM